MIKDFRPSERVTITEYELVFYHEYGCGLGFPCDKDGNIIGELQEPAQRNLNDALAHPEKYPYAWNKVEKTVRSYREPASGICKCGVRISLTNDYYGACECPECGQWWNLFGEELKNPERWNDYGEFDEPWD